MSDSAPSETRADGPVDTQVDDVPVTADPRPVPGEVDPRGLSDQDWAKHIFQIHGRAIRAAAFNLLGDYERAEDVTQEVLINAWRHRAQLDDSARGSVRMYLVTAARNAALTQFRRAAVRPREAPATAGAENLQPAGDHAEPVTDQILLAEALTTLSPDHLRVIELVYFADRSMADVAAALALPVGTVKSRAFYALRHLRDALHQRDGEG